MKRLRKLLFYFICIQALILIAIGSVRNDSQYSEVPRTFSSILAIDLPSRMGVSIVRCNCKTFSMDLGDLEKMFCDRRRELKMHGVLLIGHDKRGIDHKDIRAIVWKCCRMYHIPLWIHVPLGRANSPSVIQVLPARS